MTTHISVCMTTCNGERYLPEQLASILVQLGTDDELVVSDDGSSDGSLALLQGCPDPRLRILSDQTFHNPSYNLENALRAARGELIVLADQDDVWLPGKLAVVERYLTPRAGEVFAIMMDGVVVDAAGKPTGRTLYQTFHASTGVWRNLAWNCYTGCSMAFTRPLLDLALPFPPGIPMHDSWLGLLGELAGEVVLAPEQTFYYRRHGGNVSGFRWQPLRQLRWRGALVWHLWRRLASRPPP